MITMGIGLGAGLCYWLSDYKLAFWVLIYAIVHGGLRVLGAATQAQLVNRADSGLTSALLIPVAWHIGGLAGYL
jgi:hypothetical protein